MALLVDKGKLSDLAGVNERRVRLGRNLLRNFPKAVQDAFYSLPPDAQAETLRLIREKLQEARDADPLKEWWRKFTDDQRNYLLDPSPEKILSGGNRAGKTRTGCVGDVIIFTGRYPDEWPERYRFPTDRPRFIWIACVDRMVQTEPGGVQDTILQLIPPGTIRFKAYGATAEVFQTAGIHHIHYDEEPPYGVYFEGQQRGIESKGTTYITMTPVKGITWVYERLVKPGYLPVHYIITADNPIVDPEELDRRSQAMTKIERLVRRSGRFLPMVGHPRFDIEYFSEALEMSRNPAVWLDITQNPDNPDDHSDFSVRTASEISYRPLALYIDPRGRKEWQNRFCIGADTSEGKEESTECAAVIVDRWTRSVAGVQHGLWDPGEWAKMLCRLGWFFNGAYICAEANNMGIIVVRYLVENYGALYLRERAATTVGEFMDEFGWYMTNQSKSRMEGHCIPDYQDIGKKGMIDLAYGPLISQGMTYQRTTHGTGKCAPGTLDDMLIADMLARMMDLQAPAIREPGWKEKEAERVRTRENRRRQARGRERTTWMSH